MSIEAAKADINAYSSTCHASLFHIHTVNTHESFAILTLMTTGRTSLVVWLQVVVHNLPWNTTWQQLKDAFVDTGTIERADVIIDSSGRSRYVPCVNY